MGVQNTPLYTDMFRSFGMSSESHARISGTNKVNNNLIQIYICCVKHVLCQNLTFIVT
jgi:hypothetical protein